MKTYLVFPKFGEVARIKATSMTATSNSIRFFSGKRLVAIFDFCEVRKAGELELFPEAQRPNSELLSVEALNSWFAQLPVETSDRLQNQT